MSVNVNVKVLREFRVHGQHSQQCRGGVIGASLGWNCGERGRHVCFVEEAGMTHMAEGFLVLERALTLAQCLEDGTGTLRSQLHVLGWLERGGACRRQPQVSSLCSVSPAWAAYLRGTVKERGCCCTSASSTFCSRTGAWAACGPHEGRVHSGSHGARRRLLKQEQWLQWASCLAAGFSQCPQT